MVEKVNTGSRYCDNCVYRKTINGGGRGEVGYVYCAYILMTNQRRPCPPGDGCTAKTTMRVYRKKARTQEQIDYQKERNRKKAHTYYERHKDEINARAKERRLAENGRKTDGT